MSILNRGILNTIKTNIDTLLGRLTSARATNLDNLNATIASRAAASTALSNAIWTDAKAGYLDQAISTASGAVNAIRTGYVLVSASSSSGEDTKYIDVTIASVNTSKSFVYFQAGELTDFYTTRLTSSTNLRISNPSGAVTTVRGRYWVVELK